MPERKPKRGSAIVEFTLVGIPLMFALISIVEIARGVWIYHTLAYAVRDATRFAIVKGQNCATPPNDCAVKVREVADYLRRAAVGLDPNELTVTLSSSSRTIGPANLQSLLTDEDYWPNGGPTEPAPEAAVGQPLTIAAVYPFRSAIAMFWPGAGRGMTFGTFNLPASSQEQIQF